MHFNFLVNIIISVPRVSLHFNYSSPGASFFILNSLFYPKIKRIEKHAPKQRVHKGDTSRKTAFK